MHIDAPFSFFLLGLFIFVVAIFVLIIRRQRELTRQLAAAVEQERAQRAESETRREEIERITASRARLMRGFSHDVKNPLGAADGYLQLLEDGIIGELTEAQLNSIGRSRRSLRAALHLIEDLLDLARAEAGQIEIQCLPMDASCVVREVADDYRAQAEAKGLALTADQEKPVQIVSDSTRVRQVLSNLVSNAVKYTDDGSVRLALAHTQAKGRSMLAIDVMDTGPGVPAEKREHIFQEFSRLEPGAAKGAGVGLAISRRIASALGGDITLESEVGRGSTFRFLLPTEPS